MFGARAIVLKGVEICKRNPLPRQPRLYPYSPCLARDHSTTSSANPHHDLEPKPAKPPFRKAVESENCVFGFSPNMVLGSVNRHRSRVITTKLRRKVRKVVEIRTSRLVVLTTQALLRRMATTGETSLNGLSDMTELDGGGWEARLKFLAKRGITEELLDEWVRILSAGDDDTVIRNFISSRHKKPQFLLLLVMARRRDIRDPACLKSLVAYIAKYYVYSKTRKLSPKTFAMVARRLVKKCLAVWPALLIPVAQLIAEYIKRIPLKWSSPWADGYKARCHVFNQGLAALSLPPLVQRQTSRDTCWEAQKILLECSTTTEPQLTLSFASYQAIRTVLLGTKKTPLERKLALRSAKSWPPYRQEWDGTDEGRKVEDTLSRSSKAGILMHEAGYQSTWNDEALTVLGGSSFGRRPSVQTKTIGPKLQDNPHTLWGARISATRNAREAWHEFQRPPVSGLAPSLEVYCAMFEMMLSPMVNRPGTAPGDTKRTFPVHDGNLSPYSLAQLEPPKLPVLYMQMLEQGLQPTGRCLAVLVRFAETLEKALEYIKDSPYKSSILALGKTTYDPGRYSAGELGEIARELKAMPGSVLAAWVALLCKLHSYDRDQPQYAHNIQNAIVLVRLYCHLNYYSHHHQVKQALFYPITFYLSSTKFIKFRAKWTDNFGDTLMTFIHVLDEYRRISQRVDGAMTCNLSFMVTKAMRNLFFFSAKREQMAFYSDDPAEIRHMQQYEPSMITRLIGFWGPLIEQSQDRLVRDFYEAVKPHTDTEMLDEDLGEYVELMSRSPRAHIPAKWIRSYMRALGSYGNGAEMVRLVDWLLDAYESGAFATDALSDDAHDAMEHEEVLATLAYFDWVAGSLVDASEYARVKDRLQKLRTEKGCMWEFVPAEKRDMYVLVEDVRMDLATARLWLRYGKRSLGSLLEEGEEEERQRRLDAWRERSGWGQEPQEQPQRVQQESQQKGKGKQKAKGQTGESSRKVIQEQDFLQMMTEA